MLGRTGQYRGSLIYSINSLIPLPKRPDLHLPGRDVTKCSTDRIDILICTTDILNLFTQIDNEN